jgi:hypothetical protein
MAPVKRIKTVAQGQALELGNNVEEFLHHLAMPACLLLEGHDNTRTRAMVTLLHGNEPSGVIALHRWLASGQRPLVNVVCIIAAVTAALASPVFSHRMLPRARDLNRCFGPPVDDAQGELAQEILAVLRAHRPESIIDVHNTSGSGPAFGVCTFAHPQHEALASLFTQRLIVADLGLGALMEISEPHCPAVTIEVGGRLDDAAHALAYEGLCRYFKQDDVLQLPAGDWGMELLHNPVRLELKEHVTLTYAEQPQADYDLTLRADIEHLNFGTVHADTLLGWAQTAAAVDVFTAIDAGGRCAVSRLVRIEQGRVYAAQSLRLFMITTNPDIAHTDCLLYAVADDGAEIR